MSISEVSQESKTDGFYMKSLVYFIWADFAKGDGTEEGEKH